MFSRKCEETQFVFYGKVGCYSKVITNRFHWVIKFYHFSLTVRYFRQNRLYCDFVLSLMIIFLS